ncbi:MAG: hypothetical protein M5U19_19815 [Microthrixaceae bacterium]|nr:hypothetical protein [Microthrixaceae bacterium]
MSRCDGVHISDALDRAAGVEGRRIADVIRDGQADWGSRDASERRESLFGALAARGYEPSRDDHGTVVLRNCPFHHLAREHAELVCGMNLRLLAAVVDHLDGVGVEPRLEPTEDACCVRLHLMDGT